MPGKGIDIEGLLGRSEAYNQIDASMGMGNLFGSVRRLDEALKSMDEILGSSGIEEFHSLGYELHTAEINKLETDLEVLAEFPQRAVSEMIENLDTGFAYAMKEAEEGISSVRIDEISLKGSSKEELVTKPSELCKRFIQTIEERKQADIEELCLLLSYEKDLTGSEKKRRDTIINRIFEERDIPKMRAVAERLSKKRICKWTQSERSFIEQILRYGAEKEKTVYQETNELVNKLCIDEYWLREDGYFTGPWYASEEKRNEAAEMLAREITITGGYDLLHTGKQEEKEKRMHAEKMQLIQVLANALRTGTFDEKTLSELEIVYTKAGKDFSMENMTLTSEGMKLLVENEKHILFQKSGFKLELGWGEVIDGLLLLGMGAAISTLGGRSNAEKVTEEPPRVNREVKIENTETKYAQSSESLAYQGGSKTIIYGTDDIANFKYNMIENPGPLAEMKGNPAQNFYGGRYNAEVLAEDRIYYRGGNSDDALGQWFTTELPESVAKVRIDTAVKLQWIDPVTGELTGESVVDTVYAIKIPKGTTVYPGPVGSQGGVYCGGCDMMQTFIKEPWKLDYQVISKNPLN